MTLILENTFASSLANILELQAFNTPASGASKPAGIENRLSLATGVLAVVIDDSDPTTYGGIRSELRLTADALNDDMWYTFEVRLDAVDWIQQAAEEISIFQIHVHDAIAGASIDLTALMIHGNVKITVPIPEPPTTPITDNLKASHPMPFDRWVRVAVHGYWKADDNGVIEVYFDGAPIFRQFNRASAYTADQPYLKMGLYDTQLGAAFGYRRAYYRNLKIYRGTESYATVLGDRPAVPLALLA